MSNKSVNFLYTLLKNRIFILITLLIVMSITVAITYIISEKFTVTTVILPPEEPASPGMSLGGLSMGDFAGFFSGGMGYSLPLMTTLADVYSEILNSRTLIDNTILTTGYIDSLDFTEKYAEQPEVALFLARKQFKKNFSASVTSSGFIQIEVTTGNPLYSVEISERVVFLLDSVNTSIILARYRTNRQATENQLAVSNAALENTTASILAFESEYGTIMPNEEVEQIMSVLTEMKGRYIETTLMARAIRNGIRSGTTAQVLELETTALALKQSIDMIEEGSVSGEVSLGPGIRNLSPAIVEYARLQTDFEMQLKMTTALQLQLEQALIQEENIESSLRILDPPRHPGWKSKPKRLYIWIEVLLLTMVFISAFLYSKERWLILCKEDPEAWNKWNELKQEIKGDFKKKSKSKK